MPPTGLEVAPNTGEQPKPSGSGPLEQFLLLSKAARGLAAVELIKQVLEHANIFVFGELLDQPNIVDLEKSEDYAPWVRLLRLFAFGVYSDLNSSQATLPPLSKPMMDKLRCLTTVTLSSKTKRIPYSVLLKDLGMESLRELEDLVIEMIYANIITGKMDQQNSWLEVDGTIARDITPDQLADITVVLSDWCDNCDNVLANIEQQIILANTMKSDFFKNKGDLETQIAKVKSNMKSGQELDDDTVASGTPPSQKEHVSHMDKIKKTINRMPRTARGSAASSSKSFWNKN